MAKKKAPGKKSPPGPKAPKRGPLKEIAKALESVEGIPEIMAMFQQLAGRGGPGGPSSRAEELLEQAHGSPDSKVRVALAKKAIAADLDLVDAYILLAEECPTPRAAIPYYEEAVAAGERLIGPDGFREMAGQFWGFHETRPYMRARHELARTLWIIGRREEAVGHLREMLKLNPGDNQGLRYTLMAWLPFLGLDDELEALLKEYPEGMAFDSYASVLLAFRRGGDSAEAEARLKKARKANKFVPEFLAGLEPMPPRPPESYSPGDRSEAILYAAEALPAWRATPGAVTWLRERTESAPSKAPPARKPAKAPSAAAKARLKKRKQSRRTWEVGVRPIDVPVQLAEGQPVPWMVLVASPEEKAVLATMIFEGPPQPFELWAVLADAIERPLVGPPGRPEAIEHQAISAWEPIRPLLSEIGVEAEEVADLPSIDMLVEKFVEQVDDSGPTPLLETPGVSPAQVAGFFGAAAEFFRAAPWRSVGSEEIIRIESDAFRGGPWFAVVMGQSGMTLGLALYENLDFLRRMLSGGSTQEEDAIETVALTVTFDPLADVPEADVEAAERLGWEVAGPEAFPVPFKKERGLRMRSPDADELTLLEACLAAIPGFAAKHPADDPTRRPTAAPTSAGAVGLVLSWVEPR